MSEFNEERPPKADSYFYLATFARLLCQNLGFDQDSVGPYQNAIRLAHDKGLQDSIGAHNAKMSFFEYIEKVHPEMEPYLLSIETEAKKFVQKHSSKSFFDFKIYGLLHSPGSATCGQDISDHMRNIMQQHFNENHK